MAQPAAGRCRTITRTGEPCRCRPPRGADLCFWHDPASAEAADQARKLGGQRRRKEGFLSGAYELEGIDNVEGVQRLLEVAALETLALPNSVQRNRTLVNIAGVAGRLLRDAELEQRVRALEDVHRRRKDF